MISSDAIVALVGMFISLILAPTITRIVEHGLKRSETQEEKQAVQRKEVEGDIERLEQDRDQWRERYYKARAILAEKGIPFTES